jgi:hypothetical protein
MSKKQSMPKSRQNLYTAIVDQAVNEKTIRERLEQKRMFREWFLREQVKRRNNDVNQRGYC